MERAGRAGLLHVTPDQLLNQLLSAGRQQRLGHFYLLPGRGGDAESQVVWVKTFIRRYWAEVEKRSPLPQDITNDSDLMWVRPWNDEENERRDEYVVDNLKGLGSFLGYRGIKSQRRFVVLEEMHKLTKDVANRMLKILEEPEGQVTYFGLNPLGLKLLPTIESRAISHALSWPISHDASALLSEVQQKLQTGYSLHQFVEDVKKTWSLDDLLQALLSYEQKHDGPAALKQELLNLFQAHQKAQLYNQSSAPQVQALYLYLTARFRVGR